MKIEDMIFDLSSIWATVKEEFPYFPSDGLKEVVTEKSRNMKVFAIWCKKMIFPKVFATILL